MGLNAENNGIYKKMLGLDPVDLHFIFEKATFTHKSRHVRHTKHTLKFIVTSTLRCVNRCAPA
jgi:hypothetical protein